MNESPQEKQLRGIAGTAKENMTRAFGIGMPALSLQQSLLNQGLDIGEPDYMKQASALQRAALVDASSWQGEKAQQQADMAASPLRQGGNFMQTLLPLQFGAQLADQLYSSRTAEALGAIEQQDKLMGMALGTGQQAGSAGLTAMGNQLQAAGMMQNYNPIYSAILGSANLGLTAYGGLNNAGWFGGGSKSPGSGGAGTGGTWTGGGVAFP